MPIFENLRKSFLSEKSPTSCFKIGAFCDKKCSLSWLKFRPELTLGQRVFLEKFTMEYRYILIQN